MRVVMMELVKKDKELLAEMETTVIHERGAALWWLGQAGFVVKMKDTVVYLDPYLSDYAEKIKKTDHRRLTAIPLKPGLINNASLVLCTHDHVDHLDPETIPEIARSSPQAFFMGPIATQQKFMELGVPVNRFIGTRVGVPVKFKNMVIHPLAAKHEEFDYDKKWDYPYQGYIITGQGVSIYHAGDTIPCDGLAGALKTFGLDIALVPINGRDEKRHCLGFKGNFTCEEACLLAKAVKPKVLIPMHYDMFGLNTVDIDEFTGALKRIIPEQEYKILRCGERLMKMP